MHSRRLRVSPALLALLLAFSSLHAAPAQSLEDAARLEASGDAPGAVEAYRGWLSANPGASRTDEAFAGLFRLLTNLPDLLELSAIPGLGASPLLVLSRLADMAGRYEEARALYERSWLADGGREALVRAVILSVEMNDREAARRMLETLRSRDPGWASVVDGLIDLDLGNPVIAGGRLAETARTAPDPRARLAALWILLEQARLSGDPALFEAATAGITTGFPGSPEQALAAGLASPVARPGKFASLVRSQETPPPPVAPVTGPLSRAEDPSGESARYCVQAGSFKVRENADELAAELARKGFAPAVREEAREGKRLFKVLAGTGLDRAAALQVIGKLTTAGYAGLLIVEGR